MDVSFGLIQKQTHVQTSMTSLVSEQRPYSMILFIAYKLFTKTFKSFWSVTISASLNDVNSSSHHSVLFLTPFLVPLVGERRNAWNTCKFVLILPPSVHITLGAILTCDLAAQTWSLTGSVKWYTHVPFSWLRVSTSSADVQTTWTEGETETERRHAAGPAPESANTHTHTQAVRSIHRFRSNPAKHVDRKKATDSQTHKETHTKQGWD